MRKLAAQQQALLDVLFAWPAEVAINNIAAYAHPSGARGLKAYQANGHALAERALQAAYPVLGQLLGSENMGALARAFWHDQPPLRGDLAQWGGDLADFVRSSTQLVDEPYLADVVTLEWALHRCASAANQSMDTASFALLMQHDPAQLQLRLAPGCAVLSSKWPVVSIINAHLDGKPALEEAGQRLRNHESEDALVWRCGMQPRLRQAPSGEAAFVAALLAGQPLSAALDTAPTLDFNAWLPMAVQTQLLLGARLTPSNPKSEMSQP